MIIFPLVSGLACLILLATFAIPLFLSETWGLSKTNRETEQQILYAACWFISYMALYFVVIFFNSAMVACAFIRMQGDDPTLWDGLRIAFSRLHIILGWAMLSGTVGLILKLIEARFKKVGEIIASLLGCAWTIASFLAVPVLVMERKGPFAALKESTRLLRNSWGEQLIGTLSFGIIFFLLNIPGFLMLIAGIVLSSEEQSWRYVAIGAASAAAWFILLGLVQSAVQCIFQAAVYLYARNGVVPRGFDPDALGGSGPR